MSVFEPELGQALFSNQSYGHYEVPDYIAEALAVLGNHVALVHATAAATAAAGTAAGNTGGSAASPTPSVGAHGAASAEGLLYDLFGRNPTNNVGASADYENEVFAMRSYCWCDGEGTHEHGCPPNFEYGELRISWYKYVGRGLSMNQEVSPGRWHDIFLACLLSLPRPAGS